MNACITRETFVLNYSFSASVSFDFETRIMSTCMSTSRSNYFDRSIWKKHADHSTTCENLSWLSWRKWETHLAWNDGESRGALPYVSGYQVPANRPPFSTLILHPITPFSSVHTQWLIFLLSYQILQASCAFWDIYKFCGKFNIKNLQNFGLKLHFCKLNNPHIWESTSKKKKYSISLVSTLNNPLFSTKSYTKCPLFSFSSWHMYMYITFIFEYPPPPPGRIPRFSQKSLQECTWILDSCHLRWNFTPGSGLATVPLGTVM